MARSKSGRVASKATGSTVVVMALYVTAVNALLWRRLYKLAETKYALS